MSKLDKIRDLALDGLLIDGGHYKQWFLEQIAVLAGFEIPASISRDDDVIILEDDDSKGYDPNTLSDKTWEDGDYYSFERGIAP